MRKVGPAWTLQGRHKGDKLPEVPGPGSYSYKAASVTPSYSINRSNRQDFSKSPQHPGPGSYNLRTIPSAKSAVFGSAARMTSGKYSEIPGPGNYEIKSVISEGPKYSLKGRVKMQERTYSPGPGQYETNKSMIEGSFVHSFTKENRSFSAGKDAFPGPGSYDITTEGSPGIKFGTENRGKMVIPKVPGPGSYNLPSVTDNKAFSIYGKMPIKDPERSPGPGVYEIKTGLEQKSYSVGKSTRFKYMNSNVPGPGAYSILVPKSNVHPIFGSAKRDTYLKINNQPGPGSYQIPETIKEGPAFSLRAKPEVKTESIAPGPGQYSVKLVERVAAPVFGTSKRETKAVSETPGPGHYITPVKDYPGWKFGSQQRLHYKLSDVPGPGAYNFPLH